MRLAEVIQAQKKEIAEASEKAVVSRAVVDINHSYRRAQQMKAISRLQALSEEDRVINV